MTESDIIILTGGSCICQASPRWWKQFERTHRPLFQRQSLLGKPHDCIPTFNGKTKTFGHKSTTVNLLNYFTLTFYICTTLSFGSLQVAFIWAHSKFSSGCPWQNDLPVIEEWRNLNRQIQVLLSKLATEDGYTDLLYTGLSNWLHLYLFFFYTLLVAREFIQASCRLFYPPRFISISHLFL